MRTLAERKQDYDFDIARGMSEYEARESAYGNEWDTPEDIAYRESLFVSPKEGTK